MGTGLGRNLTVDLGGHGGDNAVTLAWIGKSTAEIGGMRVREH